MIACYAWTDTQIVNMIQVLRTFYSDESADLFVLKLGRISDSLLDSAEHLGVFRQICRIPPPADFHPRFFIQRLPGIKTVFVGRHIQARFTRMLSDCPPEYTLVLLPGFWAESLHFLRALFPGDLPPIRFVEEGMYSYLKDSFRCRIDSPWKERLERPLRYGAFYARAARRVEALFLYRPAEMNTPFSLPCIRIPALDVKSAFWRTLFSAMIPASLVPVYQSRKFIFLAGALKAGYESSYERTQDLIRLIANVVGPEDLIIRPHPASRQALNDLPATVPIDGSAYWFEGIGAVVDLHDKTLIARNSSALSAFIRMGAVPARIILTYKLYDYYHLHGDPYRDELAQLLCQSVDTFVPSDEEELRDILLNTGHTV